MNGDGKIIREKVMVVESFASGKNFKKALNRILILLRKVRRNYNQGAIGVIIDNRMFFV